MKLLANENFPRASYLLLQKEGFDIKAIALECPGITDEEVMEMAMLEERLIITFDRDYGELIFKYNYKPQSGVIYLRFQDFDPYFPANYLKDLLRNGEYQFEQMFTVIDEKSIRQRKYQNH